MTPENRGRIIRLNGHQEVAKLPRRPDLGRSYWLTTNGIRNEYTHQLFRFPAKFHAPVVRWALGTFGRRGSVVLDPFTGSGTVQVEALLRGIDSIGVDVDPLACFIAKVKCTAIESNKLRQGSERIKIILGKSVRTHLNQEGSQGADISLRQFDAEQADLDLPPIPNMLHWFRRYVVVDLALIFAAIDGAGLEPPVSRFFKACAASIIRRVSNADPTPVSGLEVTSVQADRNKRRTIKVFDEFFAKVERNICQMNSFTRALDQLVKDERATALVLRGDVSSMKRRIKRLSAARNGIPLLLTSPPYCRAVDYSRRHKLEMFWLGLVESTESYSELSHHYIGRHCVKRSERSTEKAFGVSRLDAVVERVRSRDANRGRSLHGYFDSMRNTFRVLRDLLNTRSTVVCVIGNSVCSGVPVMTADYIPELLEDNYEVNNMFRYAIRNHYMQYGLRNGEGIREEHVLVLKPR